MSNPSSRLETLSPEKKALLALRAKQRRQSIPTEEVIARQPRVSGVNKFPLSFAQQRTMYFEEFRPGTARYNFVASYKLKGTLNLEAWRAALNEIVRRHEVLRASVSYENEDYVQVIQPEMLLDVQVVDWERDAPSVDADQVLQDMQHQACVEPFDLFNGPLVRTVVYRLSEHEHQFLWMQHHLTVDGWSQDVFEEELKTLYTAYTAGLPSPLPELDIQYVDYAVWQREWMNSAICSKQLEFWRNKLSEPVPAIDMPNDFPRPSVREEVNSGVIHFDVPEELADRLRVVSRQNSSTFFMTLLTAFKVLLASYSGEKDIIVGTPMAGRSRMEFAKLIGYFSNTLAIRSNIQMTLSFADQLRHVRDNVLDAGENQDIPFDKLIEELKPARDLSRAIYFDTMFLLERHGKGAGVHQFPGLNMEPLQSDLTRGQVDLTLTIIETGGLAGGGSLLGGLTFSRGLYREETAARIAEHYCVMLERIAEAPEKPLYELTSVTPSERRKLLVDWRAPEAAPPDPAFPYRRFERQAELTPDAAAVTSEGQTYTYRELNERANQLAHYLSGRGVGRGTIVGLYMDRSAEIMIGLLGVLKTGAAYVPLEPRHPAARVRAILQEAGASFVVTEAELRDNVSEMPDVAAVALSGDDWTAIASCSKDNPDADVQPSDLMYILFTSGSTGKPKGVEVEHRMYANYLQGILDRLQLESGLHYAMVSTFAADLGTTMIWPAFSTGGTLHIIPYERAADPEAFAAYCRLNPIDVMKIVPSHFEALFGVADPTVILPRKRLIFAGEASHWKMIRQIRALKPSCTIQNHYGPTETTVSVLTYNVPDEQDGVRSILPLGRPINNVPVYILNEFMQPVPIGVTGELYIGGASVSRGYYGQPGLTAERFVEDPFAEASDARMYRTGDLVRYRPDGNIEFVGRADHQVKIRGYRIETGEVEHVLLASGLLRNAAVIAREDEPGDKRLVAYVVPHGAGQRDGAAQIDIGALRREAKEILPDYMLPSAIVALDRLPLNANGKLDRAALPAPDPSQLVISGEYVAPRNEEEEMLAAVWAEVLGIEQVGIDHDFFDLGGDSFKSIKVVRKLGNTFSVMELFKYPTIRELSERLQSGGSAEDGMLIEFKKPVSSAGRRTKTIVCVPFGGGNAITFQPLSQALPRHYGVLALQLPGHDFSKPDEPLESFDTIARRCVDELKEKTDGDIVLYGHCLGGALVLKIALLLEAENIKVEGVFMAGTFPAARLPGKLAELWHKLFPRDKWMSDKLFRDMLRAHGGLDDDTSQEEQRFVLRNMRHDAREAEDMYTMLYAMEQSPRLRAPITCVVGSADRMTEFYEERYLEWKHFGDDINLHVIEHAGHYFHKHQVQELSNIMAHQVRAWAGEVEEARAEVAVSEEILAAKVKPSVKSFLLVTLCLIISLIGTSFTGFALGIWVYQSTGSLQDFATISLFALVPMLVLLPFAGAVVDRYDRRKVLLFSQFLTFGCSLFVGAMLYLDMLGTWTVYTAACFGSIAAAFLIPAYQAAIAQLIPKRYLGNANGIAQLVLSLNGIMAPAIGGALVVMIGLKNIIIIDIVSLIVSITILSLLRFPNTMFRKREEPMMKEITGGWKYIINRKSLVAMVVFFIIANFMMSLYNVLTTPFLLHFMTADKVGLVIALEGTGLVIGSIFMTVWGGFDRRASGMVGFVILTGAAIAVVGIYPSLPTALIGLFLFGFSLALVNTHWMALIQSKVGLELQGRVFATNQVLAFSMRPLSFLLAAPIVNGLFDPLADILPASSTAMLFGDGAGRGMSMLIVAMGVILFVWAIIGMRYRTLRYMEDILPDAVAEAVIIKDKDKLQQSADRQLGIGA